jgi:flagella basal body P-ring formation protein FlgA
MRVTSVGAIAVVHAGDIVRLWRQEDLLRIEVAGVSEESGSLGQTIRVRLLRRDAENQTIQEQFSGIVRGQSDVEMQP